MTPLKTSLLAGAAFFLGWAAHEGLARLPERYEPTAPTAWQREQAQRAEEQRRKDERKDPPITPLNTLDPAALVMAPSTSPGACAGRGAEPCDCTAQRLRKAGRARPESF